MKVRELIEQLKAVDPNLDVAVGIYGEEQECEAVHVVDEQRQARLTATEYPVRCKWVRVGPSTPPNT